MRNYYVAEYSVSQNCFHVETVNDLLKVNMHASLQKQINDYLPIGFFETEIEAHDFIEKIRPTLQGDYKLSKK